MVAFLACVASNVVFAGCLALLAAVVTRFLRNPHFAHAIWLLVLIKLVTPPIVHIPVADWMVASQVASKPTEMVESPELKLANGWSPDEVSPVIAPHRTPSASNLADAATPHRIMNTWDYVVASWGQFVLAGWAIGTIVIVSVGVRRHVRLLQLTVNSQAPDRVIANDAKQLARHIGLPACPSLRVTAAHICPFVAPGMRKPVIVLPRRLLAELNRDQVRSILAHELAHVRRRDHWVRIFQVWVLALNWWNPIAWWASRQLRRSEEECCDAWVVWALPEKRRAYGETLLQTVEYLTGQIAAPLPTGTAFLSCELERRIEMIMNRAVNRKMSLTALACVLTVGTLVLPIGVALGLPVALSEPAMAVDDGQFTEPPSGVDISDNSNGNQAQPDAENDSKIRNIIEASGVTVFYEYEKEGKVHVEKEPPFSVCLEKHGDEYVIATVYFEGARVDDATVGRVIPLLERLPHLRAVEFCDTHITDKGLDPLVRLDTLERLYVRTSGQRDEAAPVRLTDAAFESIAKLKNLEELSINNGSIKGEGCRHLNSLAKLRSIDFRYTDVDDTTLEYLKGLTQLRSVCLWGTGITDAGLAHLGTLPNLEEVYLSENAISDRGLAFLTGKKEIRVLDVAGTGVTDASLAGVSQLELLQELRLSGTEVSDAGLSHLGSLKHLRILELGNTAVTDSGLAQLESFKQLEFLTVGPEVNLGVTDAAFQRLRQALPQCRVD